MDDILLHSKTWNEHLVHVSTVLQTVRKKQLYCKASKCDLGFQDVLVLGHMICGQSIFPDPKKSAAVQDWPAPSSVKEVRKFLSFDKYFSRFSDHYSTVLQDA